MSLSLLLRMEMFDKTNTTYKKTNLEHVKLLVQHNALLILIIIH